MRNQWLAWVFSLSDRGDLVWSLIQHLSTKNDADGHALSDLMKMHWVDFGDVTKVHILVGADDTHSNLRNELIALGENGLDELLALHPWIGSSVVEGLWPTVTKSERKEIYALCQRTDMDEWLAAIPANTLIVADQLVLASRFARHVKAMHQTLRTVIPVVATACFTPEQHDRMAERLYEASIDEAVADELGANAGKLVAAGVVHVDPNRLTDNEAWMYKQLCQYMSDIHSEAPDDDAIGRFRTLGNAVGLRHEEVDYLVQLGLLSSRTEREVDHVRA